MTTSPIASGSSMMSFPREGTQILPERGFLMLTTFVVTVASTSDFSKQRSVFETLRHDLLAGRYSSGKFPSERVLMMRFKASRGLIRNVMRELTFAGFVNARPRSGYVVSAGARNLGGCIGLIVPGVFHEEIFSPICQEISRIAHEEGYVLLFDDISGADEGERRV